MAWVHGIGQMQRRTVHVYRLVSQGPVKERIGELEQKKLFLDRMVNRGTKGAATSTG